MKQYVDVVCAGMCVLDVLVKGLEEFPQKGSTSYADTITMCPGGDAANQAIVLGALGHEVRIHTLLGNDGAGKYLRMKLQEYGIHTEGIIVRESVHTSTSVVLIDSEGERSFLSAGDGSVEHFSGLDFRTDIVAEETRVVSLGSLFASPAFDVTGAKVLFERAREINAATVADFVPGKGDAHLDDIKEVLSLLDYAIPSYAEGKMLTGKENPEEIADVLLGYGVKTAIIKMGSEGVYAKNREGVWNIPIFHVKTIDTTGAGDNFVAGFISGLLRRQPLRECLRIGCAVAAISVGSLGACTGVRNYEQIKKLLEKKSD